MTWQGYRGLYFAGHWTTVTDLQETALYSELRVARTVNAGGARLASFTGRLAGEGKSSLSSTSLRGRGEPVARMPNRAVGERWWFQECAHRKSHRSEGDPV
ncbi:hypothetical protein [Streptomyces sp. NPDC002952]|uniref:hypothetical protein n=1 Tax=Streptomyces sp. NPDC002952 TaxID=3364673 RepID=UPI0036A2331E